MSEHKIPIPSMVYNAAVGGHVTSSQQIIDENLNREQNDINQEIVGAVPYNSTTPNGMGRIVLKKNDNFKQVVEAQTDGNTIFVIKYDFTLTDDVTIPANCVLEFYGGSLSGNYTLIGNNTRFINPTKNIFNAINIAGTWNVPYISSDFFADAHQVNRLYNVFKLCNDDVQNTLIIEPGDYYQRTYEEDYNVLPGYSNMHFILNGIIHLNSNNNNAYRGIVWTGKKNIHISGNGIFEGDRATNTATGEHGHGIEFGNCSNVLVEDITVTMCFGDGINCYGHIENAEFRRCTINWCRRCGIAIYTTYALKITDCQFEGNGMPYNNIAATNPRSAIVVEGDGVPTHNSGPIKISNNRFVNNYGCISFGGPWTVYGSEISNNIVEGAYQAISIAIESQGLPQGGDYKVITICNNYLHNIEERAIQIQADGCVIDGNRIFDREDRVSIEGAVSIIGNFNRFCNNIIKAKQGFYLFQGVNGVGHNIVKNNFIECYGDNNGRHSHFVIGGSNFTEIAFNKIIGRCTISGNNSKLHDNYIDIIKKETYYWVEVNSDGKMEIYNNTIIGHSSDYGITSRGFDGDCWNNHFESVAIPYMRYDNNWIGTIRDEKVIGLFADKPDYTNVYIYPSVLRPNCKGSSYFATDKGVAGVGAMIYYTGDNTTPWVYADGTAVS